MESITPKGPNNSDRQRICSWKKCKSSKMDKTPVNLMSFFEWISSFWLIRPLHLHGTDVLLKCPKINKLVDQLWNVNIAVSDACGSMNIYLLPESFIIFKYQQALTNLKTSADWFPPHIPPEQPSLKVWCSNFLRLPSTECHANMYSC